MNEDTKPEDEWDDSLNDLIFGTAGYKEPEQPEVPKQEKRLESARDIYNFIYTGKSVTITFADKASAERCRIRIQQIKKRTDTEMAQLIESKYESLIFKKLGPRDIFKYEISLGQRQKSTANYNIIEIDDE